MADYSYFYKEELPVHGQWDCGWDVFVSAYNLSDRVDYVFKHVVATHKIWVGLPDYSIKPSDFPANGILFDSGLSDEAEYMAEFFAAHLSNIKSCRVCIDITGFVKPYMMFFVKYFFMMGGRRLDVIFSEPDNYARKEETLFSDEKVLNVRQVVGFEGVHSTDTSNDVLIIGAGYDHSLVRQVVETKDHARRKLRVFGFPSLRPDMYQENILRSTRADEAVGVSCAGHEPDNYFAPANDPFVTAGVLHDIWVRENQRMPISNLYLSPLATKGRHWGSCFSTCLSVRIGQ